MFALDVEQTRGEERLAARQARAMVEATAATILQNIGKGFLGRLRYKVHYVFPFPVCGTIVVFRRAR